MIGASLAMLLVLGQASSSSPTALVEQLGSPRFAERERATEELAQLGAEALPVLRAALEAKDPEVRARAAVLIEKLKIFEDEIAARNRVAERYARSLGNVVTVPRLASGCTSIWAQYTIRLPKGTDRDGFAAALKAQGIPTMVYYTKSMHQQTAYKDFPVADGGLPVSEMLSDDVISLPIHAYLDESAQDRVIEAVRGALSS